MTRASVARILAIVGCALCLGGAEASAAALEPCKRAANGRACATLTVPLDRTGVVPGTIKLRIERQRAKRSTRPPLFLLANGAGQSATDAFDSDKIEDVVGTEARSRDLVVMDLRGTGRFGDSSQVETRTPVVDRPVSGPASIGRHQRPPAICGRRAPRVAQVAR